jgi:hypothetical protein
MSFSTKSVYRLVSPAGEIGVKQFTLCLKDAHPGTGESGAPLNALTAMWRDVTRVSRMTGDIF